MFETLTIAEWRKETGMSLQEFAERLDLSSKGHVSNIETSNKCAALIAIKIEKLSGGRIDAASLNSDVAAARAAIAQPLRADDGHRTHDSTSAIDDNIEDIGSAVPCDERDLSASFTAACLAADCPHSQQAAA